MGRFKTTLYEGPTGPQALLGWLKMNGAEKRGMLEALDVFLEKNGIPVGTGRNWIYHGTIPREDHMRKVAFATWGWVTPIEWYRLNPAQPRWLKVRHLWEET